ncbi:MAG: trypsin-like peptidase domain-containing protein [Verrucomicrobiota bacterium]
MMSRKLPHGACLAALLLAGGSFVAQAETLRAPLKELISVQMDVQSLLPKIRSAVVAIRTHDGTASGVIINAEGLILTAAHVAEKPGREMLVVLDDGKKVKATTLGLDKTTDAALMQLHDTDIIWPHVKLNRNVLSATPGTWCFALGHPGGFDQERGVVLRVGKVIRQTANALQTDCVLMGGDSGGPLFNLNGEVIGIHSQIWEERDHNMHVSMAPFLRSWDEMKSSLVIRVWDTGSGGYLGAAVNLNAAGKIEVLEVLKGSPAQQAGLLAGDIVEALETLTLNSAPQFSNAVRARAAGDEVMLQIRRGENAKEMRIKLGTRPKEDEG